MYDLNLLLYTKFHKNWMIKWCFICSGAWWMLQNLSCAKLFFLECRLCHCKCCLDWIRCWHLGKDVLNFVLNLYDMHIFNMLKKNLKVIGLFYCMAQNRKLMKKKTDKHETSKSTGMLYIYRPLRLIVILWTVINRTVYKM